MVRKRVLFVSESVTLAQVVRLYVLASSLDPSECEVHFAAANFSPLIFTGEAFQKWSLPAVDGDKLLRGVEAGKWVYDRSLLKRYIKDDLDLLQQIKPDLVVGDFRLSLAVSAPLVGVKVASLINAYFSPYRTRQYFPLPDHPIIDLVGFAKANEYFPKALPYVLAHFAKPLNRLRKENGLSEIGDLLSVLNWGDNVLFPDTPELVPTSNLPSHHRYLGPVLWQPNVSLPQSWQDEHPDSISRIYVTLGSSGRSELLPLVLEALSRLPVRALVATLGKSPAVVPSNVTLCDFAPGSAACKDAALAITNGGSTTGYQALAAGVPVLGVSSNLDQYLAMDSIEQAGAGIGLRAGALTVAQLEASVLEILRNSNYRTRAQAVAQNFAHYPATTRFQEFMDAALLSVAPVPGVRASGARSQSLERGRLRGQSS